MSSPERASEHLTLQSLWACRTGRASLSETDFHHLYKCDECLRLLGMCQMAKTYEELQMRVTDFPLTGT